MALHFFAGAGDRNFKRTSFRESLCYKVPHTSSFPAYVRLLYSLITTGSKFTWFHDFGCGTQCRSVFRFQEIVGQLGRRCRQWYVCVTEIEWKRVHTCLFGKLMSSLPNNRDEVEDLRIWQVSERRWSTFCVKLENRKSCQWIHIAFGAYELLKVLLIEFTLGIRVSTKWMSCFSQDKNRWPRTCCMAHICRSRTSTGARLRISDARETWRCMCVLVFALIINVAVDFSLSV